MKINILKLFSIAIYCLISVLWSEIQCVAVDYEYPSDSPKRAIAMLGNLKIDNDKFVRLHDNSNYFDSFIDSQHPRMTLVMCVDSRVHHHAFDQTPDNDIFTIRNLSGQFQSNEGSILYGVKILETPLLLIMGHDDCGAVKTKTAETWEVGLKRKLREKEVDELIVEKLIKELEGVEVAHTLPIKDDNLTPEQKKIIHQNIKYNIHCQVDKCFEKFKADVENGKLIIAGALYDFQGKESEGRGRLVLIDVRDKEALIGRGAIPVDDPTHTEYIYKIHPALTQAIERLDNQVCSWVLSHLCVSRDNASKL